MSGTRSFAGAFVSSNAPGASSSSYASAGKAGSSAYVPPGGGSFIIHSSGVKEPTFLERWNPIQFFRKRESPVDTRTPQPPNPPQQPGGSSSLDPNKGAFQHRQIKGHGFEPSDQAKAVGAQGHSYHSDSNAERRAVPTQGKLAGLDASATANAEGAEGQASSNSKSMGPGVYSASSVSYYSKEGSSSLSTAEKAGPEGKHHAYEYEESKGPVKKKSKK